MKHLFIITGVILFHNVGAQHLFPEKFDGCVTDRFALEKDSTDAKIDDEVLVGTVMRAMDEKTRQKISGVLTLQIIVDTEGTSCLISARNDTNVRTRKMNLKEVIDRDLVWDNPKKKVAAIVVLRFSEEGVSFKRLGVGNQGFHELVD